MSNSYHPDGYLFYGGRLHGQRLRVPAGQQSWKVPLPPRFELVPVGGLATANPLPSPDFRYETYAKMRNRDNRAVFVHEALSETITKQKLDQNLKRQRANAGATIANEVILERARKWAVGSPFSCAEPYAAQIMRDLIDALEAANKGETE